MTNNWSTSAASCELYPVCNNSLRSSVSSGSENFSAIIGHLRPPVLFYPFRLLNPPFCCRYSTPDCRFQISPKGSNKLLKELMLQTLCRHWSCVTALQQFGYLVRLRCDPEETTFFTSLYIGGAGGGLKRSQSGGRDALATGGGTPPLSSLHRQA